MINAVYNVVQELLNKNGYGLLTPTRFVYFAEAAQLKVLNDAIEEFIQKKRNAARYDSPETLDTLDALIEVFATSDTLSRDIDGTVQLYHALPDDYMRWGSASLDDNTEIAKQEGKYKARLERNRFVTPSLSTPFCHIEGKKMFVYPTSIGVINDNGTLIPWDEVTLHYYRYPKTPNWTYQTVFGKPVFNPDSDLYQDFELPSSMMDRLIVEIAEMAGVHVKEETIIQYVSAAKNEDMQKSNR